MKSSWLALLLVMASCYGLHSDMSAAFKSRRHVRRDRLSGRSTVTRLYESYAVGSGISIEPTVYQEDLYGILGVSLNASRVQLRDAYWAIAFKTHPDRNDTPEALCEFRNASYAYKVLGRSEKTRSDYDSKYRTKQYIESMDQLSNNVIPFAIDVAMPLIDLTVRGIGSFAVPFFKDAFEQSSALFHAAFTADEFMIDEDEELTGFEAITRAANAAMRTGLEQRIRRTRDGIVSTTDRLNTTSVQLKEAMEKESEMVDKLEELKRTDEEDQDSLKTVTRETESAKQLLLAAQLLEKSKEEECIKQAAVVATLMEGAFVLRESRSAEEDEISRLEAVLSLAKERNRNTLIKQTTLDIKISTENRTKEVLESDLTAANTDKTILQATFTEIEKKLLKAANDATKSTKDKIEKLSVVDKQKFLRNSLERKNAQLEEKKTVLEKTLGTLETEWNLKEGEAAFEKNRISMKRKEAEERAAEKIRSDRDLAEIAEMELSIRRREKEVELMEIERNQLVQQEKIEREKLREDEITEIKKRSDDIAAINASTNIGVSTNTGTNTPPISGQRGGRKSTNPFSRKEKYAAERSIQLMERKRMEDWMSARSAQDFNDFYTS